MTVPCPCPPLRVAQGGLKLRTPWDWRGNHPCSASEARGTGLPRDKLGSTHQGKGRDGEAPALLYTGDLNPAQRLPSIPKASPGEKLLLGMNQDPPTSPSPASSTTKGSGEEGGSEPRVLSRPIPAFSGSNKRAGNVSAKLSAGPGSAGEGREEMGIHCRIQGEQPLAANVLWVQRMGQGGISPLLCPDSTFTPCLGPERGN